MNAYDRIAEVIRYLDTHYTEQPDLTSLARRAGLSPFHFHRLFTGWAGITPKDFIQCLTLSAVKQRLVTGGSVLKTALDTGLSGPGRLHDLCVTLEAASPGEIKSGGQNLRIQAGWAQSPFGWCLIGQTERGVCHLSFADRVNPALTLNVLRREWPRAQIERADKSAARLAGRIFDRRGGRELRAWVSGTPFQIAVWRALIRVPRGRFISYGHLAARIHKPAASRAVGTAVGSNPIAFLIPCHRVIRQTGVIGNYHWGPVRKRAMIAWESAS